MVCTAVVPPNFSNSICPSMLHLFLYCIVLQYCSEVLVEYILLLCEELVHSSLFLFCHQNPYSVFSGECNTDYVQFGRDILFITSYRSNKYVKCQCWCWCWWLSRFCGSIQGLTVLQPYGVNSSSEREGEKVPLYFSSTWCTTSIFKTPSVTKSFPSRWLHLPSGSTLSPATRRWTSGFRS